jgi:hypothetical protein
MFYKDMENSIMHVNQSLDDLKCSGKMKGGAILRHPLFIYIYPFEIFKTG